MFACSAAGSSNGRTSPSGGEYLGSNPGPAALRRKLLRAFGPLFWLLYDEDTDELMRGSAIISFMFYVYILECADRSFYVGCTNNLEKRVKQHNESRWGAHYTKLRRPVVLRYSEQYQTLIEARRREAEIKGWRREKKMKLINGGTL